MEFLRFTPTYIILSVVFACFFLWFFSNFLKWSHLMNRFPKSFNYKFAKTPFIFRNLAFIIWFVLLFVALLWPIWTIGMQSKGASSNILFLVDLSKSMEAADAKDNNINISRLEKSKKLISKFVSKHSGNSYALIWFAWDSVMISPFTTDSDQFLTYVSWLNSNLIQVGWSQLDNALDFSLKMFSKNKNGNIVMFSNWPEDLSENSDTASLLKNFEKLDYKVFTVWIWTLKWAYIPTWVDFFGNTTYKIYNSERVVTRQNSDELKKIAKNLKWEYIDGTDSESIESLNSKFLSVTAWLKEIERKSNDIGYYFILAAFLFFVTWYLTPYKKSLWKS